MEIKLTGVKKYYHSEGKIIKALDGVNLTIPANKIFTLLGPSGCGKTTLLRSIVGLETPDEGEIRIGDTIVWSSEKRIDVPTEKRGLGMVFQTYAIWPHMDVFNNVAYPLQNMKLPKDEIARRVEKTLQFVQLEGFGSRPATRLSGGQQQRVALARALVAEPKVILFDEPLSNLDAKLREETRKELRSFLSELQITAVYVTHDRIEALALSDQIGVMRAGNIIEIGDPKKIYFDSEHQFVADFIGRSNLLPVTIEEQGKDFTKVVSSIGTFICSKREFPQGSEITLCIRPEFIDLIDPKEKEAHQNTLTGSMHTMVFVGEVYESEIMVGDQLIMVKVDPDSKVKEGDEVVVSIAAEHCLLVAR
ncbi:MAG: ABC transporter ATP-binding protein [Sphaerochaeta sp.]|jgi:iron(III) transport system ATP-binding protein|nr:ABC transporter ATP-binding protein [Sphaerochaeta sp.]HAP56390.1 ABC transporter ATP-binding protein [Sphaerochaeta sp.]